MKNNKFIIGLARLFRAVEFKIFILIIFLFILSAPFFTELRGLTPQFSILHNFAVWFLLIVFLFTISWFAKTDKNDDV